MAEIVLTKKKEMDLFTMDGLIKQTGTRPFKWDIYILKELLDNALDICESADVTTPRIEVAVRIDGITVRDNGHGITRDTIDKIVDLNVYAGSKYYFLRPSRGRQGNALLTILPMPYVVSRGEATECATIRSGRKQFSISVEHDDIQQDYMFRVSESDLPEGINGTEICVKVSLVAMHELCKNERPHPYSYISLISNFAVFNSHCEFMADIYGEKMVHNKTGEIRKIKSESESIHWYSYTAFRDLIYAYLRAGQGSLTIKNFCISRFRGISNSTKNEVLLKSMCSKKLEDLRDNEADIEQLLSNLREICRVLSPSVLGEIGKEQLQSFFGSEVKGTRYKQIEENLEMDGYIVPFVLEGVATQTNENTASKLYAGLNNSPLFYDNSISRLLDSGELSVETGDQILTAIHLICPNVSFSNYSKAEFDLNPFMPAIKKLLKSILGDYYKGRDNAKKEVEQERLREQKEREERERKEKQEREKKEKEKKLTMQEVFDKTIGLVYYEVTDKMKFEAYIRQAFYKHRPVFAEYGFEDIDYGYYVKPLVRDWEQRMGRRMFLRETRGVLLLPDRDEYIQIDTKLVNSFVCPDYTVKNLFYIEKRGFADALRAAKIHRRYDIAILSGQGYTTDDIKLILHKIAKTDEQIKVFCFHDCDIYGIHILNNAGKEHYIEGTKVEITSLGILPPEAVEKKYPVEWYEPKKSKKTKKAVQFDYENLEHILYPEDFKWLAEVVDGKRRRVELNIFSPLEFIQYVEKKIKEAGITEKLLPPVEVIENTIDEKVKSEKDNLVDNAIDYNLEEIDDMIEEIKTAIIDKEEVGKVLKDDFEGFVEIDPEDTREEVKKKLEGNPPESWKHFTEDHVMEKLKELKKLPEWENKVRETVNKHTNGDILKLLKSLYEKISKNSNFTGSV